MKTQNHGFPSITPEYFLCRKYFAYFLVKKIFWNFLRFFVAVSRQGAKSDFSGVSSDRIQGCFGS
jgi:hypothetical protein